MSIRESLAWSQLGSASCSCAVSARQLRGPSPGILRSLVDMDPFDSGDGLQPTPNLISDESSETCKAGQDRKSRTVSHEFANFGKAHALGSRCCLPGLP